MKAKNNKVCTCDAQTLMPFGECQCGNPPTFGKYKIKRYGENKTYQRGNKDPRKTFG